MQETQTPAPRQRYIHVIIMAEDEVGQIKTVLDGKCSSVNINREDDGTGHMYATFDKEISRAEIEKAIELQQERQAEEEASNGSSKKAKSTKKKAKAKSEASA